MQAVRRFGTLVHPVAYGVGLATLLGALALPAPSRADDSLSFSGCNSKPKKADTAEAKRAYERGKKLFDERDRGAIDLFRSAYLADCTKHELLVLLSFAYQSDGQLKEALAASELYLDKRGGSLTGEDRKTVEDRIASLRAKVKEQDDAVAAAAARPATEPVKPPPTPPPAEPSRKRSPYPWVLVGIGAASLVTGAVLLPLGRAQMPEGCEGGSLFSAGGCSETLPNLDQSQVDAGKAMGLQRAGMITMAAGGAAVVGGLIWFAVDASGSSSSTARRVVPNVGPGYLGVSGAF